MRADLGHCEALYLRLQTALSPGDGLTLLVSSPDQRSISVPVPLGDTILLRHIPAVFHHLGVPHLLLGLGAPHDLVLGREHPHTPPWFVQHLQPTHWECFHLGTRGGQWCQSGSRLTFPTSQCISVTSIQTVSHLSVQDLTNSVTQLHPEFSNYSTKSQ